MGIFLAIVLLLVVVFGPGIWVQRVMSRYSVPEDRYSGSGGQLARHLLDRANLQNVMVEVSEMGDHYDPEAKAVRLSADKLDGHSLTAITVAAHEVGHALQDQEGYAPLRIRTRLVKATRGVEKIGAGILLVSPFLGLVTRVPYISLLTFAVGIATLATAALVHLITLPTEFNASFARALPMLDEASILKKADQAHAHKLLTAAALTYVSASLMSLLNIARWFSILRR